MRVLLDTNILIGELRGHMQARDEIASHGYSAIRAITWMEVMAGAPDALSIEPQAYMRQFKLCPIDDQVAEEAVKIRRAHRLNLPDAIIWATARLDNRVLVTRNTKDFAAGTPGVRIPYGLGDTALG